MLCLILVALFAFIVIRALVKAMRTDDPFIRFAAAGLAILFGLQSTINMAVNLHLMPAKGMTLPFISYGGSSLISLAYGMGMLLALTRERPRAKLAGDDLLLAGSAGLMARARRPAGCRSWSRPAARAAICSRPRRWRRRSAKRGIAVHLATDRRAARFGGAFPTRAVHVVASATLRARNPIALARTAALLGLGFVQALDADRPAQARGGHRLRRLSDRPAGAGRGAGAACRA